MSFRKLFEKPYGKIRETFKKPVLISEFSSASEGGNKAEWIRTAMDDIKQWRDIKGFVLFNVDKEVDWSFPAGSDPGKELKKQLEDPYFRSSYNYDD